MTFLNKTQSATNNRLAGQSELLAKHRVVGLVADSVVLQGDEEALAFDAKCAVSCLLKPMPGDLVLVSAKRSRWLFITPVDEPYQTAPRTTSAVTFGRCCRIERT